MNKPVLKTYHHLLNDIKQRVKSAQYQALKAVNRELVSLYWDIGRMIVKRQRKWGWGKSIVLRLSIDLQNAFPGLNGFSTQNLWRMRQFYETYPKLSPMVRVLGKGEKLSPLVTEIGWTHNIIILTQCKTPLEREFYIRMTLKYGWSKDVLSHHIESKTYQKTLLNQTNFEATLPEKIRGQAKLAVRDEYAFGLLELGEEHSEKELERAILGKMEIFLREMGGLFAFLGSQYRLEVSGEEYFIDLLLYHRALKSLVAVELKIGKFLPEFVGKMQFYLALLDSKVRLADENPAIGIILCKNKDKTIVEYALRESNKPIGVATYKMVNHLPKSFKGQLPEPAQIAKLLDTIKI